MGEVITGRFRAFREAWDDLAERVAAPMLPNTAIFITGRFPPWREPPEMVRRTSRTDPVPEPIADLLPPCDVEAIAETWESDPDFWPMAGNP